MKKHRPRIKKSAAKDKQQTSTPLPTPRPSEPPLSRHRHPWRATKWTLGAGVAVIGLVASIAGIWGPVWPTDPVFSPNAPSFASPLDVSFVIQNKSILFTVNNPKLSCRIFSFHTEDNRVNIDGGGLRVQVTDAPSATKIKPEGFASYVCPINQLKFPGTTIKDAKLSFIVEYDSIVPQHRTTTESQVFTLNTSTVPAQWTPGEPLR